MSFACCNCGEEIDLDGHFVTCSDCGGMCCNTDCRDEHECDPEGDM